MDSIKKFFRLEESGTTISRELVAGATTFFAMVYIIFVNPNILFVAGMPKGAVFLATIFATIIGTLIMGLFANVPYAQAPGMGLNAFFTYVVCSALGFTWQEALALVFICGIINIIITVTKVRKSIIKAIPRSLQSAIGGGIGVFIAYIGFKNGSLLNFAAGVPAISDFATAAPILTIIGILITVVLLLLKVRGAILIGIVATAFIGWPLGLTDINGMISEFDFNSFTAPFADLEITVFAAFKAMPSLFGDLSRLPLAFLAIFAFSLTDTFDTIGTFIGTGRRSGIFTDEDMDAIENSKGFKTKMEKALFADSVATSIGAILGTSNTTTYIESAAGIEEGGRTGLTSVFTAIFFALCIFLAPVVGIIPESATAPALVIVGIMMIGSFKDIEWTNFEEAVPAFFAAILMALAYNISIGIAFAFIFYVIVKAVKGKFNEIHPILWVSSALFILYFVLISLNTRGII